MAINVSNKANVDEILGAWPSKPQEVARKTIEQYGLPQEAIASRLVWYRVGSWKRVTVYRDEVPHNFPKPHTDLLKGVICYRVPLDKYGDIARFDGSVVPARTYGEVGVIGDQEEMNFLALNLMHDIVTGKCTVEQAREFYAETALAWMVGKSSPYIERLLFPPREDTREPDESIIIQSARTW